MNQFKSRIIIISAIMLSIVFGLDAKGTKDEAQTMVKKAIAYFNSNGQAKAFEEINNKDGQFVKDDLYIFVYDMSGKCVAHGFNNKQIGKNLINAKDPDGREYVKERIEIAKTKGSGWQDYKFSNPTTFKIENKTAYIEKAGNFIFGCGVYK